MLNASVGVQRVVGRLRPTTSGRPAGTIRFHRRSVTVARDLQVRAASVAASAEATSSRATSAARAAVPGRIRTEGLVPAAVIAIVLVASLMSWLPGTPASAGPIGDTTAVVGSEARIALGGGTAYRDGATAGGEDLANPDSAVAPGIVSDPLSGIDPDAPPVTDVTPQIAGAFREDGTLLKPIAVNTAVADGKDLLRTYKVRKGDTLTGIANRFGVSMMTIWWANKLSAKDRLVVGQTLTIPPVNGLVYSVKEGDSLESLATRYKVSADEIYETNGLEDRALLAGQTLILPGAVGKAIETPKPKPPTSSGGSGGSGSSGGTVRPPSTYGGGSFVWPVVGGGNQISQYFHYGHYGIDIAADYGSRVRSAAGGTVIFAGWKSNGGGYQVWIAHGSGLYTTYNHMSGVSVGRGQHVSRGQQVGRIGASGWATGPHLHFEVWRGPIWNGGSRVNPLRYF